MGRTVEFVDTASSVTPVFLVVPEEEPHEILTTDKALLLPFGWHDELDREWGGLSFHNSAHIRGDEEAILSYFNNSDEENDPLLLQHDLTRWNNTIHIDRQVDLGELCEAFLWKARFHDTGNIMHRVKLIDGVAVPEYVRDEKGNFCYRAEGAEARSIKIFETVIRQTDMDPEKMTKMIPLVKHLIDQTRFAMTSEDEEMPFAGAVRFIDQVAASLFCHEDRDLRALGLAEEIAGEDPQKVIRPYFFVNFIQYRAGEILGDRLSETLVIFGKELPESLTKYPDKEMMITEFLRIYGTTKVAGGYGEETLSETNF